MLYLLLSQKLFMMFFFRCLLFSILFFQYTHQVQAQKTWSASTVKHSIDKLGVVGSVLYIAAHPDDENTRLISYLTNEKHYRTAYLSLTRGDGGQNLIGNEQGAYLGIVRTQELLEARKMDGGQQFFTRAIDFGYSKNPDETFKVWNKDSILYDVVWVIRNFQPDVIICRFPTTGEGGHGHHTASAILAEEAFVAAADPNRFPEQLKYVEVWKSKRLLWNTFNFGSRNTTSEDQFKIDVGGYQALLGKSYGEIAAESRSKHSSQSFGTAKKRDAQWEYFKTIIGDAPKNDLLDGVTTSWLRFSKSSFYQTAINNIIKNFDYNDVSASAWMLANLYDAIQKAEDIAPAWKTDKLQLIQQLIAATSGLWIEANALKEAVAVGDSLKIQVTAVVRSETLPVLKSLSASFFQKDIQQELKNGILWIDTISLAIPDTTPISQPYWLLEKSSVGRFSVTHPLLIGKPENDPALSLVFHFEFGGIAIPISIPVLFKKINPARGEEFAPLVIAPPVSCNVENEIYIFADDAAKPVGIKLRAYGNNISGNIQLQLPEGWTATPPVSSFHLENQGDEQIVYFDIAPSKEESSGALKVIATVNGIPSSYQVQNISYEHILPQMFFEEAKVSLLKLNLIRKSQKIAYISGAGDKVADVMRQIGYQVNELTENEVLSHQLLSYDAIITGVRAFNTRKELKNWMPYLLKYVEEGGNFVAQYNTSFNLTTENLGPYPFDLSRKRVTEEDAAVNFSNPQHQLLLKPNQIAAADFDNWIQERGLYFPDNIDARYQTLFSMHDTGEAPLNNALITTEYGKGRYTYTGLSFFRELPAGVAGAIKLWVNLLDKK